MRVGVLLSVKTGLRSSVTRFSTSQGAGVSNTFRIVRELGRGGMATVYIAEQTSLRREIALKVLAPGLAIDPAFTERFLREGRLVASLRHRHIVTVYDVGELDGKIYIAMEYLPLGSIAAMAPALEPPEVLRCIRQIAGALDYAHRHGIVHRDVKPENVLRHEDGAFLLSDFGIAQVSQATMVTAEGQLFGTPAYMSPERWRDEPLDGRSDLYSLGVMLHELLTGKVPYTATDNWAVGMKHLSAEIPTLPEHFSALQDLQARLLAKDRDDRFSTGAEVVAQIESLEREGAIGPVRSGPPTPVPKARTSRLLREWPHQSAARYFDPEPTRSSRGRRPLVLGLGVVVLGASVAVALAWQWTKSGDQQAAPAQAPQLAVAKAQAQAQQPLPSKASLAVLPFVDPSATKDQEYFGNGLSQELLERLSTVPGLHVTGRTSSFSFAGKKTTLADIGRELNVANVLKGSASKSIDRLHVTATLVRVADEFPVWSQTYDCPMSEVFTLQDQVAAAVIEALKLTPPVLAPPTAQRRSASPEAYDEYLRARQLAERGDRGAVQAYSNAIAKDPGFATAYAGLAVEEYYAADSAGKDTDQDQGRQSALSAADRALSLDPDLAEAYIARGYLRTLMNQDLQGALADFEHGLAINPADATALRRYGVLLATLGRLGDAVATTQKAIELDPLSEPAWSNLGRHLLSLGQLPAARKALNRAIEISPGSVAAHFNLGLLALQEGNPKAALGEFQKLPQAQYFHNAGIAMAEHALGHAQQSQQVLDALIAAPEQHSYAIAMIYMARDDRQQTFAWLDRARARHDGFVNTIKAEPLLAKMRDDPRYAALLQKMGLPQ